MPSEEMVVKYTKKAFELKFDEQRLHLKMIKNLYIKTYSNDKK